MRRLILPAICILAISLFACEKYIIPTPEIPEGILYSTQIQPIFDNSCVGCHPTVYQPDLTAEESYDALIDDGYVDTDDPESSVLYTTLRGTHESRATEEEKLTILQWITEGALNN